MPYTLRSYTKAFYLNLVPMQRIGKYLFYISIKCLKTPLRTSFSIVLTLKNIEFLKERSFELALIHRHFQLALLYESDLCRKSYFQPRTAFTLF